MRRNGSTPKLAGLNQSGIERFHTTKNVRKAARILKRDPLAKKGPLELMNDEAEHRFLHATKGYRDINLKRSVAALITHELRQGQIPFSMTLIQFRLKERSFS